MIAGVLVALITSFAALTIAATEAASKLQAAGHWAFQPLPRFDGDLSAATAEIDRLVNAQLEAAEVAALGPADSRTLLRRVYFQLIGLPPTRAEIEAFLADESTDAFDSLVDNLLARTEFGERWGRHWLDVARYADSNGCSIEANNTYDNAWRYRDYVIAAINDDKPFDKFVVEQVAGDLLEATTDYRRAELLIATGFLQLGPKAFGTGNFEQLRLDAVDDQIDTIGKAMLGLSLGCARCHDHKLEPVTAEDYYSLAGIFGSTTSVVHETGWRSNRTWRRVPLPMLDEASAEQLRESHQQRLKDAQAGKLAEQAKAELKKAEAARDQVKKQADVAAEELAAAKERVDRARFDLRNAERLAKVLPVVSPVPAAMAVTEAEKPHDEPIRLGGEPDVKDAVVPRGVLPFPDAAARERYAIPAAASGRLELARWMVDVDHGAGRLTARVIVNRVWRHLIGQGIVPTVDNFGLTGEPPSHPELLDHLASTFVADGWSVKRLIRRIVLSETYRRASGEDDAAVAIDPENRLLGRRTPRRLEVEALRDSVLAISGQLDRTRGGKTLQHLGLITINEDMIDLDTPSPYRRRTVYLPVIRDALGISRDLDASTVMLTAFDAAPSNLVCGARNTSIVPAQALFLMNSDFLADHARHTAERLLSDPALETNRQRIDALFLAALARPATADEAQDALRLIDSLQKPNEDATIDDRTAWSGLCQAVFSCNEFLFLR